VSAPEPHENETLRWPTNLDRAAIVQRLVQIRHAAHSGGHEDLVKLLADVEGFSAAQIGQAVIGAMNQVQEKPEHGALASQLAMLAMNLKNLR
jgi:hypothetical protein